MQQCKFVNKSKHNQFIICLYKVPKEFHQNMFSYQLPEGLKTRSFFNSDGQIKFDPPVYEQRYTTALRILEDSCWETKFKKVVDFGCAELRLVPLLRRVKGVEHILAVDIDEELLSKFQSRAVPLLSDHLQKRESPLRIEILKGSIDASVENLRHVDAIIALEIIEHLYPDVLDNIPYNVFGYIQPKLAIFSTPNSEFNVLFQPLLENGFRHLDHKFEWTRKEFKAWALNICERFPNYNVSIMGVGKAPPDHKKIGYVTQIAIFARLDVLGKNLIAPLKDIPADTDAEIQYKEIYAVDFPFYQDTRTKEQKILDELRYHIDRCRRIDMYYNRERELYQVPLNILLTFITNVGGTEEQMRMILLENSYNVEGDFVVVPEYGYEDEDFYGEGNQFWSDNEDAENDDVQGAAGNSHEYTYDSEENWD